MKWNHVVTKMSSQIATKLNIKGYLANLNVSGFYETAASDAFAMRMDCVLHVAIFKTYLHVFTVFNSQVVDELSKSGLTNHAFVVDKPNDITYCGFCFILTFVYLIRLF